MNRRPNAPNYKWYILSLAALTNTLAVAAPSMGLAVLFQEISGPLNLNLVQVGLVWGIGALPGILSSLLSGALGDRFGPKRVIVVGCLLAGLAGAGRGLALDFFSLAATVVLFGLLVPLVSTNVFKVCGLWFPRQPPCGPTSSAREKRCCWEWR